LDLVSVDATSVEAAADWDSLWSPENYLGYERTENFASSDDAVLDTPHGYAIRVRLRVNHWALSGDWTVKRQAIVLNQAGGRIAYRFHARDLHLVMGPAVPGTPVRFHVRIDGQAPGAAHGTDVDDQGNGTVTEPRLYQLIRQPGPVSERTFEITFLDPGLLPGRPCRRRPLQLPGEVQQVLCKEIRVRESTAPPSTPEGPGSVSGAEPPGGVQRHVHQSLR
jgi:hypothetical protein